MVGMAMEFDFKKPHDVQSSGCFFLTRDFENLESDVHFSFLHFILGIRFNLHLGLRLERQQVAGERPYHKTKTYSEP
jgi:hypothetical protein